ncbi:ArsR family transcriptional regulator [Streptomyces sparsogenes]|uniref:helix-turn-helix transcriptional regulator n=1 Tax=Streptomyces sparsogenes TaxID=67365 RepID=UPI00331E690D
MKYASEAPAGRAVEQAARSAVPAPAPDEQHGTRNRVARSILDHGPSTAAELALRLELTQAAVRRHLDTLVADGVVEPREKRVYGARGRGRPAKVFALTDCGRDAFDQAYDKLAVDALRWIEQSAGGGEAGREAVAAFARARLAAQAAAYREAVEAAEPQSRAQALARALSADGYAATARSAPVGEQLCQHHCPVAHAAERFPQLCEAETEVFSQLLGTHVQRLATIAHGDGVCTTFIPGTGAAEKTPPSKTSSTTSSTTKTTTATASASTAGRNPE